MNKTAIIETKMGSMPMEKLMLSLSWPAMLSMLIQALYNIVDSMFVGRISEAALSAVTFIFPIQMLLIAVVIGTGIGVGSLISRSLGAKDIKTANIVATHGFFLSYINWAAFALFGIFGARAFMNLYNASNYITENGTMYLRIVMIGSLFVIIQVNTEKILQATGNTVMPMLASLIGAVINIFLDPVLIFGIGIFPNMGVIGAAIATVIGQFAGMCIGLFLLFKYDHAVTVSLKNFQFDIEILKKIYKVGAPSILMQAVSSLMLFLVNAIIAVSQTAVAVFGSYFRLQSFIFLPVFGLNQGAMPIIAYNFGAKDKVRLMDAFKVALKLSSGIMLVGMLIFLIYPNKLLLLFSASPEMLKMGVPALRILSICFVPAAFGIITSMTFQAMGHGILSMWQSLIRQLVGIAPIAYIIVEFGDINYVWWAFPLAEILGITFAFIFFQNLYKKEISTLN